MGEMTRLQPCKYACIAWGRVRSFFVHFAWEVSKKSSVFLLIFRARPQGWPKGGPRWLLGSILGPKATKNGSKMEPNWSKIDIATIYLGQSGAQGHQNGSKTIPKATKMDEKLYIGPSCANNSDVNWSPTEPKSISQRSS